MKLDSYKFISLDGKEKDVIIEPVEKHSSITESEDQKSFESVVNNLNIDKSENYARTAEMLEYIKNVIVQDIGFYAGIGDKDFLKMAEKSEKILEEKIKTENGNYLLKSRIAELLVEIRKIKKSLDIEDSEQEYDYRYDNRLKGIGEYAHVSEPYIISPDTIAFIKESQIYFIKNTSKHRFEEAFDEDGLSYTLQELLQKLEDVKDNIVFLSGKYNEVKSEEKEEEIYNEVVLECRKRDRIYEDLEHHSEALSEKNIYLSNKNIGEEKVFKDYLFLQQEFMREKIEKDFNLKLATFTIPEQFQFLNFLKTREYKDINKLKDFTEKFSTQGFRTFLSIEQGGKEMGDKILELGEKLPENIAKEVFNKYGEIVEAANKAEEEIKNLYEKENIPSDVFEKIRETLLKRGVILLSCLADKKDVSVDEQSILKELEDIKTQTIIMGSSYLELHKQGIKIPIEDISNTTLDKVSAQDMTDKEKKELLEAYEKGRPKETYENKEHIEGLKKEFEQTLNNKDTFVFNVRFNNEIVAFATFYKENEDTLHIGGLTYLEDVRNPAIGLAVMNSIMNELGDYNIKAEVHSKNKIFQMYQKRFGFKVTKEMPLEENAGELYYEIERPKNIKEEKQELNIAA
ncbi:MAG: GNAT family N-acetyltransferase [Minisyncoccia bacterium]